MKHSLVTLLLAISMLLVACSSDVDTSVAQNESSKNSTSPAPDTTVSISPSEEIVSGTPASNLFIENEDDNRILLLETEEFVINFIIDRNILSGETSYYYEYTSKTDFKKSPAISIENIQINNTLMLANGNYLRLENPEKLSVCAPVINIERDLANYNMDRVTNISGTILASKQDEDNHEQYDFDATIPASIYERYFIAPCKDALATAQTLYSDNSIDINIIAFGNFNRSSDYDRLDGLISCTNKTDHVIPFEMQSTIINGWCITTQRGSDISPGMTSYYDVKIDPYRLNDLNITSIYSLDLLILTDDSENTSVSDTTKRGGKLYSVSLAKSGIPTPQEPLETILYQSDNFTVYESDFISSSTSFSQYFIIENNSSQIISYGCKNGKINGINQPILQGYLQSLDGSYLDLKPTFESIPPGSRYRCLAAFSLPNPTDVNNISFEVNFYSAGGGKLIETSDIIEVKHD